jgi:uncharacterized GH25 family protein
VKFRAFVINLFIFTLPSVVLAHEFWIAPNAYQVAPGEQVTADLINGQKFNGYDMSWFDSRILRSEWSQNRKANQMQGRAGDVPALKFTPLQGGLVQVVHQTTMQTVRYHEREKFTDFVAEKDLQGTLHRHEQRGLPETGFAEGYSRFAKSLIAVGKGQGKDRAAGLDLELVAQANPYTDRLTEGLPILLLYQGKARANTQVEVFERRGTDKLVSIFRLRTDTNGMVHVPLKPGHSYLIDAVLMREPAQDLAKEQDIVWESLWASLTFARP